MVNFGLVMFGMLEVLFKDFVCRISLKGLLIGNVDVIEWLLVIFLLGEKVFVIMEEIWGLVGWNMWEKLLNVQENVLVNYLKNEYLQIVVVVFFKINFDYVVWVLGILLEELVLEVVSCMLCMDVV